MRPVRWRRDRATVKGVKMSRLVGCSVVWLDAADNTASVTVRNLTENGRTQQIDAAAYALADLVATLRGLE